MYKYLLHVPYYIVYINTDKYGIRQDQREVIAFLCLRIERVCVCVSVYMSVLKENILLKISD